jgi:hypothetical protein
VQKEWLERRRIIIEHILPTLENERGQEKLEDEEIYVKMIKEKMKIIEVGRGELIEK